MTENEFKNLQHRDKIQNKSGGQPMIVHNNHRSTGMVVIVRTEVIFSRQASDWFVVKQHTVKTEPGTYIVQIVKAVETGSKI